MEVKLREREGKKKTTLMLAIWNPEIRKWKYEPLKLYLYAGREYDDQNKETRRLAEIIRTKRQLEVHSEGFGEIPEHKKRGDFILFFENMGKERDRNWRFAGRVLRKYHPSPLSFKALNGSWAIDFQKYLLKNYSQNMAWLLEVKVRAGIREALRKQMIARDFLIEAPPIRFQQKQRIFLTAEEIQHLAETPCTNDDIKRAFLFSCFTGLRWSDYSVLTWRNIEADYIRFTQQKTGEPERLPLNATAKELLKEIKVINLDKNIFTLPGYNRVLQVLSAWGRRAGLDKKITTHTGRHSYAFLLLTSGVDLYDTSKALGHKSISMTMIYAHLVPEELRKKLDEKLPTFKLGGGAV